MLSWRFMRHSRVKLGLLIAAVAVGGVACSFKKMGVERMADAISATASTYSRDNDPEFERLLKAALAVDIDKRPTLRLANLIAQKRAAALLARLPQLF